MKWIFKLMLPAMLLASCSEEGASPVGADLDEMLGKQEAVAQGRMSARAKRDNPYSVTNMRKAYASLYSTRADYQEGEAEEMVPVTDYYVRFLPMDKEDFTTLDEMGVVLVDTPLDSEPAGEGDQGQDQEIMEGRINWQYAVVPSDFGFPDGIQYEVLEECCIPDDQEEGGNLGADGTGRRCLDWPVLERRAFECSGNTDLLEPVSRAKVNPAGRITITDNGLNRKTVGVAGVKVVANVFVKVSTTFTDASGNYSFPAKFSAKPNYRLCFKNSKGFSIGLNAILVPASLSDLGKGSPDGITLNVDGNSDATLYRRCAVNNAAYEYYDRCQKEGITLPPKNLRFWIINSLTPSSALMMHHGSLLDQGLAANYLGMIKIAVQVFCPDITIGSKGSNYDYVALYADTVHEMAHASHFIKVGTEYWNKFTTYIISSYLITGDCYGTGNGENAGYCEIAEMWAYYIENAFKNARYGSSNQRGFDKWFKPQIFKDLEAGGMTKYEISEALKTTTTSIDALKSELLVISPSNKTLINNTFKRYSK